MNESNGPKVRRYTAMCAALALVTAVPSSALARKGRAESAAAEAGAPTSWARAYAKGQWAVTVALLEAIPERERIPAHWLHLARAREKLLRLVEAIDAYERVQEMLPSWDTVAAAREVRRSADVEAGLVARRIPWADVGLGADVPPGAYVFVDDRWLPPARLRSPYPVNPGWHTFLLEADGEVLAARRVYFEESQQRLVLLAPKPERTGQLAPSVDVWPAPPVLPPSVRPPPVSPSPDVDRLNEYRAASYFAFGAGALGLLMGAGFTIYGTDKRNELIELNDQCGGQCESWDPSANDLRQQIHTSTQIANTSFVLGGLCAVTGGVFFLLGRKDEPKQTERAGMNLKPMLGLGAAGVSGRF